MAQVKNLSKEVITSITAGNITPGEMKKVADWEVPLLEMIHGKRIEAFVEEKKKGKK